MKQALEKAGEETLSLCRSVFRATMDHCPYKQFTKAVSLPIRPSLISE